MWSVPVLIHRSQGEGVMEIRVSLHPTECQGAQCLTGRVKVLQSTPLCIPHVQGSLSSAFTSIAGVAVACMTVMVPLIVSQVFVFGNTHWLGLRFRSTDCPQQQ